MVDSVTTIANALLALLTSATASVITWAQPPSRAAKIWSNVEPPDQPCMYLINAGGNQSQTAGYGASKGIHHFHVLVYMRADGAMTGTIPEDQLLAVWAAINNAMNTNATTGNMNLPGKAQNLGLAFVNHAWIEGDWFMDTGILDQQCALVIPIKVAVGIMAGK